MIIHLSEDRGRLIASPIQPSGPFASAEEVIDTALQLLREQAEQTTIDELRREIATGIDRADRGEFGPFDPLATLARIRSRQAGVEQP